MITRIFQVTIHPEKRTNFERDFNTISVEMVRHHHGLISCQIGYPTKWTPDTYTMITNWLDEQSLVDFAGPNWNTAVIPQQMQQYARTHSVVHFNIK